MNWCYEAEPDPGINGRSIFWPRGKVLGGSSSINGMVYIRGQHEDFDLWRQFGNAGWSSTDVLPYFKRAQHQMRGASEYHSTGGPLCVSDTSEHHPICEAFIQGAMTLGHPRNDDFNGEKQDGVGYHQTTTRNGKRCSTAVGYLHPVRNRPNLRVVTGALAEKMLFDGKRATGVAFREHGQPRTVRATREVILCGGAVNSPQLLLLSGVGPEDQLAQFGIPVVHALRGVGQSLQDHYSAPIKLKCRQAITVNDVMQSNLKKLKVGLQYYMFRTGPLSMAAGPAALFVRTRPELATPDVKISVAPFSSDKLQEGLHPWSGFGLTVYQLRPESRGEIRLKSANPADPPAMFAELPGHGNRPARHRRWAESRPPGPGQRTYAAIRRRGISAGCDCHDRRAAIAACEEYRRHRVPSDQHVQNGQRSDGSGRCGTARARHARAACGRCVDHADGDFRQHQCRHDHDRREGG